MTAASLRVTFRNGQRTTFPSALSAAGMASEVGAIARPHGWVRAGETLSFAAADVMALVSKSEGLANAWVEALACGTPVVASNVGGAPELVRSPDAGRIVAQDVNAIVEAIDGLLANPVPPERVAAQVAHFSWDRNAKALESVFQRILSR